jgi:hypothetical protein
MRLGRRLRWQAEWCRRIGSPLYERLLERAAEDAEAGGPVWSALEGREHDPLPSMLALRFMGAIHRLVLEGRAPELGRFYPSAGGTPDLDGAAAAFLETVAANLETLRELVANPVQTNEVGRSATLLGGFLLVAAETGLPLRLLEVGASAGLNLRFDRYFYSSADSEFGDPTSRVRFLDAFDNGRPRFDANLSVAARGGCDMQPLDPTSETDRLTLLSYLWPDQTDRFTNLRAALDIAATVPVDVERADAPDWTERNLADRHDGCATVVFHSIMLQYLSDGSRSRFVAAIEAAGERAAPESPLAWLRMEPGTEDAELRLTSWPGGGERLLAHSGFHGPPVRWLDQ